MKVREFLERNSLILVSLKTIFCMAMVLNVVIKDHFMMLCSRMAKSRDLVTLKKIWKEF